MEASDLPSTWLVGQLLVVLLQLAVVVVVVAVMKQR